MQSRNGGIYAVRDNIAGLLIGGLQLHRAEAAAIRTFGDIAATPNSVVKAHPADFDLIRLGYIADDFTLVPDFSVVITGSQWVAAQTFDAPEA